MWTSSPLPKNLMTSAPVKVLSRESILLRCFTFMKLFGEACPIRAVGLFTSAKFRVKFFQLKKLLEELVVFGIRNLGSTDDVVEIVVLV
jgi:hypothetical protein